VILHRSLRDFERHLRGERKGRPSSSASSWPARARATTGRHPRGDLFLRRV